MIKNINLKKIISTLVIFLTGVFLTLVIIYFCPNIISKSITTIKKDVTIVDTGISESVEKVYDAVVVVSTYSDNKLYSTGTGFVYKTENKKAYILTNNHVISGGDKVTVTFTNGQVLETGIVGSHELSDIAVLSVDSDKIISVAEIGSSLDMKVGDTTFAVGAPIDSVYSWTVTRGILSGKDRMIELNISNSTGDYVMKALQTDTAINSGNSGGPLCNANGQVIGITSLKLSNSSYSSTSIEGMGFAIPIETAINYATKLESGKEITQPYIGISMINVSSAYYYQNYYKLISEYNITSGVIIADVENNSPADKAGLKSSDVIIKVNENSVQSIGYLRYYLYEYNVGDKVSLTVIRSGKEKTLTVTLGTNTKTY